MSGPEPRTLHFDWPDGLRLDVQHRRLEQEKVHGITRTWSSSSGFTWRVRRGDGGCRIEVGELRRIRVEHAEAPPGVFDHKAVLHFLRDLVPDLIVDEDGQLVAVDGLTRIHAAIAEHTDLDQAPPALQTTLRRLLSPSGVQQMHQGMWNGLVGLWAGRELEVGAGYRIDAPTPLPLLGGRTVPQTTDFALVEATDAQLCLSAVTELTEAALETVVQALATGPMRDVDLSELRWKTTMVLRADPAGLVPQSLHVTSERSSLVAAPDGSPRWVQTEEFNGWAFEAAP